MVVYTFFYAAVFVAGLVGNVFVVLAVVFNTNLRSVTDYLISSLALADLLIILFCLPTTLLNNLLTGLVLFIIKFFLLLTVLFLIYPKNKQKKQSLKYK